MSSNFVNVVLDGVNVQAREGLSLLQACFLNRIDVPRFCYHENLKIAGNCRMCLLEVSNNRKLVASCATPLVQSFEVWSKTFRVKRARQSVLEFLLINHPLDCPICDQGGECDLQDITLMFGADRGRFYEVAKRAVVDKHVGPLVKTLMNRCIHCTRCVRFFEEVSGSLVLGTLGRGSLTEIGSYLPQLLLHELSGNVIDLCPVGALTSKPFAFKARAWELQSKVGVDFFDASLPQVRFDVVNNNIIRVLPLADTSALGWITNKTRFCYDALSLGRLESCLWNFQYKVTETTILSVSCLLLWEDAFSIIFSKLFDSSITNIFGVLGGFLDLNSTFVLKNFWNILGGAPMGFEGYHSVAAYNFDFRSSYLLEMPFFILKSSFLNIFLCGVNLRTEAPVLFYKLRVQAKSNMVFFFSFASLNTKIDTLTFQVGVTKESFLKFFEGRHFLNRLFLKSVLFTRFWFLYGQEKFFKGSSLAFYTGVFYTFLSTLRKIVDFNYKQYFVPFKPDFDNFFFSIGCVERFVGLINACEEGLVSKGVSVFDCTKFSSNNVSLKFWFNGQNFNELRDSLSISSFNIVLSSWCPESFVGNSLYLPINFLGEYEAPTLDLFGCFKTFSKIINNDNKDVKEFSLVVKALVLFFNKKLSSIFYKSSLNLESCFFSLAFVYNNILGGFFSVFNGRSAVNSIYSRESCFDSCSLFLCNIVFVRLREIDFSIFGLSLPNYYFEDKFFNINFSKTMVQSAVAANRSYISFF